MNSIQVNCFLEAAKCNSFSQAASNLYISQPTFSRNISALESELGVTHFHRNTFQGICLTESGQIMFDALSSARKQILTAQEKAYQAEHEVQLHLTFGLLKGQLLDDRLENMIMQFRILYPNTAVNIKRDNYQDLMTALYNEDIDIIYMPTWQFSDRIPLTLQHISDMETFLVVPKRLLPEVEDREYSLTYPLSTNLYYSSSSTSKIPSTASSIASSTSVNVSKVSSDAPSRFLRTTASVHSRDIFIYVLSPIL